MDCHDFTTDLPKHKKGAHLTREERMAIRVLKALQYSIRGSPGTVLNELRRGTPPRKSSKGRASGYSEKRGDAIYKANRRAYHRRRKLEKCQRFIQWVIQQVREHKWSLDACCGYAKLHHLFDASEMVCSRTLYNWVWANLIPLKVMELPEACAAKLPSPSLVGTSACLARVFPSVPWWRATALRKVIGKATRWSESAAVRRRSSSLCWRRRQKPTLPTASAARPARLSWRP